MADLLFKEENEKVDEILENLKTQTMSKTMKNTGKNDFV